MNPEIGAALIAVGAAVIGFLLKRYWWDRRDQKLSGRRRKEQEHSRIIADLGAASSALLASFDDRGEMKAAEHEARARVQRICEAARRTEDRQLLQYAEDLHRAASASDRDALRSISAQLTAAQ